MKNALMAAALGTCLLLAGAARAQQVDLAFGSGTVSAPSAGSASVDFSPQSIGGGNFMAFSGNVLLKRQLGFNAEVAWRTHQALYGGYQPIRPLFWDFNGVWAPSLSKRVGADLMAGIGVESVRVYQSSYQCGYTGCTNYTSSNHFLGHFGGGIKFYLSNNVFFRPEAHLYLIHNNVEFSSGRATRYGASLGYTFGR